MYVSSYFLIVQLQKRKENPRGNPLGAGDSQEVPREDLLCAATRSGIKIEKRFSVFLPN